MFLHMISHLSIILIIKTYEIVPVRIHFDGKQLGTPTPQLLIPLVLTPDHGNRTKHDSVVVEMGVVTKRGNYDYHWTVVPFVEESQYF